MSRRLRIETGASPFRVSLAGYDAAGATFDQVLFDANQAPLKLWYRGYTDIDTVPNYSAPGVIDITYFTTKYAHSRPSTPSGTFPIFALMWRTDYADALHYISPSYSFHRKYAAGVTNESIGLGVGGVMGTDGLYVFNTKSTFQQVLSNRAYFAIFENYL